MELFRDAEFRDGISINKLIISLPIIIQMKINIDEEKK